MVLSCERVACWLFGGKCGREVGALKRGAWLAMFQNFEGRASGEAEVAADWLMR